MWKTELAGKGCYFSMSLTVPPKTADKCQNWAVQIEMQRSESEMNEKYKWGRVHGCSWLYYSREHGTFHGNQNQNCTNILIHTISAQGNRFFFRIMQYLTSKTLLPFLQSLICSYCLNKTAALIWQALGYLQAANSLPSYIAGRNGTENHAKIFFCLFLISKPCHLTQHH